MKDKNGALITNRNRVLKVLEEIDSNLFSSQNENENKIEINTENEPPIPDIIIHEIRNQTHNLKEEKAVDLDKVPIEMVKYG